MYFRVLEPTCCLYLFVVWHILSLLHFIKVILSCTHKLLNMWEWMISLIPKWLIKTLHSLPNVLRYARWQSFYINLLNAAPVHVWSRRVFGRLTTHVSTFLFHVRERERERRDGRENIKSICPFWFREMAMPQHPRLLEIHFKTLELTFIISRFPDI